MILIKNSTTQHRGRLKKNQVQSQVRVFSLPKPNYAAKFYQDMIDWKTAQLTEPPILKDYTDEQITAFVEKPLVLDICSNTQFVERLIKVITQKGCTAADPKLRDGFAKATLKSQKALPRCQTKEDFSVL